MKTRALLLIFLFYGIVVLAQDSDNDGLQDSNETNIHFTDPFDADTDDDGLSDGDEINIYQTNPLEEDTDNDGVFDGTEVGVVNPLTDTITNNGFYIADADSGVTTTNPLNDDTDGDGLLDGQEDINKNGSTDNPSLGGTGTVGSGETDPNSSDSDTDTLSDGDEVLIFGTNPLDTDTDDGGVDDGTEINVDVTDPLDFSDDTSNLTYVPDDNFENHLETHDAIGNIVPFGDPTSMGNGIANDDYITTSRINTVEYLYMPSLGITDLTGIEDFVALKNLQIPTNQLTTIDVSQNTALELFYCPVNQLTSLDVSANTALIYLNCFSNQIAALDVSNNPALQDLSSGVNPMTSLDVSLNTNLNRLIVANGQLTSLNVKNGNNTNFVLFNATTNPNLTCIEVDDAAWSTTNWTNKDANSTFVNNQSECATLSTEAFETAVFSVFPNPSKGLFNVNLQNATDYNVFDINGKQLKQGQFKAGKNNLNINMFSNGLYFLQITSAKGISTKKIIKQ